MTSNNATTASIRASLLAGLSALTAGLVGCAAHAPPKVDQAGAPVAWQSQVQASTPTSGTPWRIARPDDVADKGPWWQLFQDDTLNGLQQQALSASPTLMAASARWRQARDLADISGASRLPRVDVGSRGTRTSANRPAATSGGQAVSSIQNDIVLNGTVSYELDLFGRLQYDQQAALAFEQQAQADLLNVRLVLSADLAAYYFSVRATDAEIAVVQQGLDAQNRAFQLLTARYEGGASSRLDVSQQQALLDGTLTQLTLLKKQRLQLEHALATLTGTPASTFKLVPASLPGWTPSVPVALPSDVLQRRPDVASAERAVAVANAQAGVASAAWFPSITLGASGGWEARDIAKLIDAPSLLWAVGGSMAQTVFDGGRTRAREDQARAGHELALANYRQTVLRALQEVEDGLSSLNALDTAQTQSQAAAQSAQKVLDIAQARYAGGLATYLDVVTAQQNVLNNQRLSSQLRGQQLQATSYLIKALGGGWQAL
ncbi:MAG: efflux transporter outer membrane subunit [Aquabacterium sp.]|nr:efflux transporter outer membrane subunit [Aquabacterium sp.]